MNPTSWASGKSLEMFRAPDFTSHKGDLRSQEALTDLDIKKKKVRGDSGMKPGLTVTQIRLVRRF